MRMIQLPFFEKNPLVLQEQIRVDDNELPLIIEHGRIVANPNFDMVAFRMGGDQDEN